MVVFRSSRPATVVMEFSSIGCPITGGCAGYFSRPRRSLLLDSPLVIMMQAPMVQKLIFGEMGGQAARSLKKPRKYLVFPYAASRSSCGGCYQVRCDGTLAHSLGCSHRELASDARGLDLGVLC